MTRDIKYRCSPSPWPRRASLAARSCRATSSTRARPRRGDGRRRAANPARRQGVGPFSYKLRLTLGVRRPLSAAKISRGAIRERRRAGRDTTPIYAAQRKNDVHRRVGAAYVDFGYRARGELNVSACRRRPRGEKKTGDDARAFARRCAELGPRHLRKGTTFARRRAETGHAGVDDARDDETLRSTRWPGLCDTSRAGRSASGLAAAKQ